MCMLYVWYDNEWSIEPFEWLENAQAVMMQLRAIRRGLKVFIVIGGGA